MRAHAARATTPRTAAGATARGGDHPVASHTGWHIVLRLLGEPLGMGKFDCRPRPVFLSGLLLRRRGRGRLRLLRLLLRPRALLRPRLLRRRLPRGLPQRLRGDWAPLGLRLPGPLPHGHLPGPLHHQRGRLLLGRAGPLRRLPLGLRPGLLHGAGLVGLRARGGRARAGRTSPWLPRSPGASLTFRQNQMRFSIVWGAAQSRAYRHRSRPYWGTRGQGSPAQGRSNRASNQPPRAPGRAHSRSRPAQQPPSSSTRPQWPLSRRPSTTPGPTTVLTWSSLLGGILATFALGGRAICT